MSATDCRRGFRPFDCFAAVPAIVAALGIAGMALAADAGLPGDVQVSALLKTRLPKTPLTKVNCQKIDGLCEVTAGANLFYVDRGARYLIIGRIYDMETRQDLTAARLLEIDPDMLVGGAARANASAAGGEEEWGDISSAGSSARKSSPPRPPMLSLASLPQQGAIIWGNKASRRSVTVFTDFRCSYCKALTSVLRAIDVKVIERPISILGSRDVADRVYCAKDQERALHAAYAGEPFEGVAGCNTSGLDANERFAHQHGLNGTPVIVRSDGAMLEGFRPRQFLETWLNGVRS